MARVFRNFGSLRSAAIRQLRPPMPQQPFNGGNFDPYSSGFNNSFLNPRPILTIPVSFTPYGINPGGRLFAPARSIGRPLVSIPPSFRNGALIPGGNLYNFGFVSNQFIPNGGSNTFNPYAAYSQLPYFNQVNPSPFGFNQFA